MIIFRPHKPGFTESMLAAKEFDNVEEMKEYIVKLENDFVIDPEQLLTVDDIIIDEESMFSDQRNGWENSMYVFVKRQRPMCVGSCATEYTPY